MRVPDWLALLARHRVDYIDRGPNVKRGEINVRCPFCGGADPSKHLGISLTTGFYSCWRNRREHSGKSPVRLLMRLLGLSYEQARETAGLGESYVDPDGFDAMAARLLHPAAELPDGTRATRVLEPDADFAEITESGVTRRWWNYIYRRGFDADDVVPLCQRYGLRAGVSGMFGHRVVMPYFLDGRLVTWTARAIAPSSARYLDLPIDEAIVPAKRTLYNFDAAVAEPNPRVLALVEGPVDVLKIDFYAAPFGVRAVGLSTSSIGDEQMHLLAEAALRFGRVVAMMDNKTAFGAVDSMRMRQQLAFLPRVSTEPVPAGRSDGGELRPDEVRDWARAMP